MINHEEKIKELTAWDEHDYWVAVLNKNGVNRWLATKKNQKALIEYVAANPNKTMLYYDSIQSNLGYYRVVWKETRYWQPLRLWYHGDIQGQGALLKMKNNELIMNLTVEESDLLDHIDNLPTKEVK